MGRWRDRSQHQPPACVNTVWILIAQPSPAQPSSLVAVLAHSGRKPGEMSSVLAGLGWAGLAALLHSGPSHPAHYLQLVQPSPLARAQAQGAAGWDHLLDQDPAPIKVPTKFRSFNSPLGFEIFDHKIISDCEQMVQFSYSLNMETCAIFPLLLYPQYNASQCTPCPN